MILAYPPQTYRRPLESLNSLDSTVLLLDPSLPNTRMTSKKYYRPSMHREMFHNIINSEDMVCCWKAD